MHVGIAGEVRLVVTKADGTVKTDTGYQKNLILNQGLDFFGGNKGGAINAYCAIGSGNSTPIATQTKLDNFIGIASGVSNSGTSDYSYVDEGDNTYRMWSQKIYRFTNLDAVNISEVGLVSTSTTPADYYLTTRVLIKDDLGNPASISINSGETLDVYYKIHKVIDTSDKDFVINILDGHGGSVPYNVKLRPRSVGTTSNTVAAICANHKGGYYATEALTTDLKAITDNSRATLDGQMESQSFRSYESNSYKRVMDINYTLAQANIDIRTVTSRDDAFLFLPFQMRLGRVSDDAPLTKTNKDTLTIPLEFSWGRYEGEL